MNTYKEIAFGIDFQSNAVKNPNPGRLRGSLQEITFGLSILVQFATLIISIVALVSGGVPPVLMTVLVLETVVQCVEIIWYSVVGMLYFFGKYSVSVSARYVDWAVTTPIMLVSILLFSVWDANKECATNANVLSGSRIAAVVCIVVLDWLMLAIGLSYEAKITSVTRALDGILCGFNGLWIGFVPFLGAFVPLFVIGAQNVSKSGWSLVSVIVTFVSWSLYGVVAIVVENNERKNSAYNLLDILSKNAVGLIVSTVALSSNLETIIPTNCTSF